MSWQPPDLFASVLFGRNRLYVNGGGSVNLALRGSAGPREAGLRSPPFPLVLGFRQDGREDLRC
jgi:hypothetical protein